LLANWKISLDVSDVLDQEEQTLMATLSQAYLEWEQQTEQRGLEQSLQQGLQQGLQRERALVLRLLTRRVGKLPKKIGARIEQLSLTQLENLGEALLDFEKLADLAAWLELAERQLEQAD
jgi:predicted transposase YdaD